MAHRVIVIGAGIIGASIAYYLSRRGAEVTLIEQHRPACGATSKSFGWINANFPDHADYFQLRERSIAEFHQLSEELDKSIGLKWGGSLWWERSGDEFEQHVLNLENYGYPVDRVSMDKFVEMEPEILKAPALSARFPTEGAVDAIACTKGMINAAIANGADLLIGCETSGLILNNNRCTGVNTVFGDFYADTIVVAVGAAAQSFLGKAGITLPMNNPTGLIAHTHPVDTVLNHLMITPDIHFRQHTNGSIVFAEDFSGGLVKGNPILFANELLNRLAEYLPNARQLKIGEVTMGTRPVPLDGYPVIGEADNTTGLYIASMHSGVTLAPIVGKTAAHEILTGQRDKLFDAFRLARFR